jgi:hypothetical protein
VTNLMECLTLFYDIFPSRAAFSCLFVGKRMVQNSSCFVFVGNKALRNTSPRVFWVESGKKHLPYCWVESGKIEVISCFNGYFYF